MLRPEAGPWLTVVMPVFNGEAYLNQALDSLRASGVERGAGVEVVLVDDGSTDRSSEITRSFCDSIPLRLVDREANQGWVTSTNEALELAQGEFCCFLHQDDLWCPGRLRAIRQSLSDDPRLDLLLTSAHVIGPDGRPLGSWLCPLPTKSNLDPELLRTRLLVQNFIAIDAPVFRTSLAKEIKGLDPKLWYTADWKFWLEFASRHVRARYDSRPSVNFRIHTESQTAQRSAFADEFRFQLETVLKSCLHPECSPAVARAARLSVEINIALATLVHGGRIDSRLAAAILRTGPLGLWTFFRYSRILDRALPRLRLRLARRYL